MSESTRPKTPRIVMDTNVLYAALRSRDGASFRILESILNERTTLLLSHTVLTEYEEILKRECSFLLIDFAEINPLLDALCLDAELFLISDFAPLGFGDPDDEAFGRLALASQADFLVTHNLGHFSTFGAKHGIKLLAPRDFLTIIKS